MASGVLRSKWTSATLLQLASGEVLLIVLILSLICDKTLSARGAPLLGLRRQ